LDKAPFRRARPGVARLLLTGGGAGVVLQLDLLPKLARALLGWSDWLAAGGPSAGWPSAAASSPLDAPLTALYRAVTLNQPLLPWLLWLVGAGLLLEPWRRPPPGPDRALPLDDMADTPPPDLPPGTRQAVGAAVRAPRRTLRRLRRLARERKTVVEGAILALLLGICILGGAIRATNLLPDANGAWPASNFDEMVYYTNARLLAQGELPYRDHFLAHPPGVFYLFGLVLMGQTPWGGPVTFGVARLWLLIFSLLAVPLIFLAGRRLGGPGSGLLAALLLALDGKAAQVAVLETAVNLWSLLALVLYLYAPRTLRPWQRAIWIGLAGACAGGAALMKVPGIALAGALPLHALLRRRPRQALLLAGSTLGGVLLGLLPFLIAAPGPLLRETFFFQMLRPQEVRPGIDQASRIADYPESALTLLGATLGMVVLTTAFLVVRGRRERAALRGWVLVVLWALPVLAVFVVGRSYHSPYYVQWAPPLALLAAAGVARPVWRAIGAVLPRRPGASLVADAGAAFGLLFILPLIVAQWQADHTVEADRVYLAAGATLADLLPDPGAQTLAFDPGYTFVAGRPPVVIPGIGRMIDSAGAMVYYGTDIDRAPWPDLIGRVLQFNRERNAQETFYSPAAQAAVLAALPQSAAVVIDGKIGEPQLRPQSIELIKLLSDPPRTIDYASVYPLRPVTALDGPQGQGEHQFGGADGLALWRLTVEGLHPDGSGEGPHLLEQGTPAPAGFLHRLTTPHPVIQFGLYWQVPATFAGPDYRIGLRLLDAAGQVVAQTNTRPDEDRAVTHTWRPGGLYPDLHNIQAPPGPGTYTVQLAVYPDGQPAAADTWIAPLRIETP
jgi:hypothetical protein